MKLLHKRILIFFSVALNIGFVIMAVFMFFNHPGNFHGKSDIEGIVQKLGLTEDQQENTLECIHRFRISIEKQEMEVKAALNDMIRMVSKKGPLDQQRLNEMYEVINRKETEKNKLMMDHVVELRDLLGDEKGAKFYSLLLEHLKNRDNPNRR